MAGGGEALDRDRFFGHDAALGVDAEGEDAGEYEGAGAEHDAFAEIAVLIKGDEDEGDEFGLDGGTEVAPHIGPTKDLGLMFAADVLHAGPGGGQGEIGKKRDGTKGNAEGYGGLDIHGDHVGTGGEEAGAALGQEAAPAAAETTGEEVGEQPAQWQRGDADGEGQGGNGTGLFFAKTDGFVQVVGQGKDQEGPTNIAEKLVAVHQPEVPAAQHGAPRETARRLADGGEVATALGEDRDFSFVAAGVELGMLAVGGPECGSHQKTSAAIDPSARREARVGPSAARRVSPKAWSSL